MFQSLLGIDTDGPGFRNFVLKPGPYLGKNQLPVQPIQWVRGEYRAPSGLISVAWKLGAGAFQYEVQVPPNTTATLHLPATGSSGVQANGGSLFRTTGVTFEGMENGRAICTLQPGAYSFVSSLGE
jgi:alpha-L-rhamnosidase